MPALINMLLAIAVYSAYPLVGHLSSGVLDPLFLVACALLVTLTLKSILLPLYLGPRGVSLWRSLRLIYLDPRARAFAIADGLLNITSHACLIASFSYVNKYAATLLYEIWPIIAMFLIPFVANGKDRITPRDMIFAGLSFIGLWLIWDGRAHDSLSLAAGFDGIKGIVIPGISLSIVAMIAMGISASLIVRLEQEVKRVLTPGDSSVVVSYIINPVLASTASGLIGTVVAWPIWFLMSNGSSVQSGNSAVIAVGLILAASIVTTFGSFFYVNANRLAQFSGLNLLWNLTPAVALVLLFLAGYRQTIPEQVFLGGMFVFAANMATSIRVDFSYAYYAALVSMCLSAWWCFFYPPEGLSADQYYNAVGLPAGIFAILFGFMMQRITEQQRKREDLCSDLWFKAAESSTLRPAARRLIKAVMSGQARSKDEASVASLVLKLAAVSSEAGVIGTKLASSRLRLVAFGEVFVLWSIGVLTVLIAIMGRPPDISNGLIVDLAPVIITSGITFMCVSVIEYGNDKRGKFLIRLLGDPTPRKTLLAELRREETYFALLGWLSGAFSIVLFGMYAIAAGI